MKYTKLILNTFLLIFYVNCACNMQSKDIDYSINLAKKIERNMTLRDIERSLNISFNREQKYSGNHSGCWLTAKINERYDLRVSFNCSNDSISGWKISGMWKVNHHPYIYDKKKNKFVYGKNEVWDYSNK